MTYQNPKFLGNGSFGTVWKCSTPVEKPFYARHPFVAIKCIIPKDDKQAQQVKQETEILSAVKHNFILEYLEYFIYNGTIFIVTELCIGDVKKWISWLNLEQYSIWRYLGNISSALAYLHENGILHRDIKPQNILVRQAAKPICCQHHVNQQYTPVCFVLADFGVSKVLTNTQLTSGCQNQYSAQGTSIYWSPENLKAWYSSLPQHQARLSSNSLSSFQQGYSTGQLLNSSTLGITSTPTGQFYNTTLSGMMTLTCPQQGYQTGWLNTLVSGTFAPTTYVHQEHQTRQHDPTGRASDIWSLAVVISELCNNGRLLFYNYHMIINWDGSTSPLPTTFNPDLRHLIQSMLSPNPNKRPSAQSVFNECTDLREERGLHPFFCGDWDLKIPL